MGPMKTRSPSLTARLLEAIEEALIFRTAGELGAEALPAIDYDDALEWVAYQLAQRERAAA